MVAAAGESDFIAAESAPLMSAFHISSGMQCAAVGIGDEGVAHAEHLVGPRFGAGRQSEMTGAA